MTRLRVWRRRNSREPGAPVVFGGYGLMVVAILALASTSSPIAVVFMALLLASAIGVLTWWCGLPSPSADDRDSTS